MHVDPLDYEAIYADIKRKRELESNPRSRQSFLIGVRCSGAIHHVRWTQRGRVTLLSHQKEELAALKTLAALGDSTCACLNVLQRLKKNLRYDHGLRGKKGWKTILLDAMDVNDLRRKRLSMPFDPLARVRSHKDMLYAATKKLQRIAEKELVPIVQQFDGQANGYSVHVVLARRGQKPFVEYQRKMETQGYPIEELRDVPAQTFAALPISWLTLHSSKWGTLKLVNAMGVDGFTLDVVEETPIWRIVRCAVPKLLETGHWGLVTRKVRVERTKLGEPGTILGVD